MKSTAHRRTAKKRKPTAAPVSRRRRRQIQRLKVYRLERDLTFDELAAEMSAVGFPVLTRCLHRLLSDGLQTKPRELTLYKVDQFVRHLDASSAVPR